MIQEIPDPVVQPDLPGIVQALADYQLVRETKSRRQMNLVESQINAVNDLLDLGFQHRSTLAEVGFLEPMQKVVRQLMEATVESIKAHNEDADQMMIAVKTIQRKVSEAIANYERQRSRRAE